MDERTITLLQESFAEFTEGCAESAALFYERLFALDPSLRRLFTNADMKHQHTKLMAALDLVISNLGSLASVIPVLENLAVRHAGYGVEEKHYGTVGAALIQTLSLSFGSRFTPELRGAWLAAYGAVSAVMIQAANRAQMRGEAAE